MKTKSLDIILTLALVFTVVSGFAYTWQQTTTHSSAGASAMSADGRIICIINSTSHPFISTNSGGTWAFATNSPPWGLPTPNCVAVSATGAKIFAALSTNASQSTWMFVSSDQGLSWQKTAFPNSNFSTSYQVACSADGTNVVTSLENGPIFYSTNAGVDCYTSSIPDAGYLLACSADGRRMFAVGGASPGLYSSSNFGVNWTSQNISLPGFGSLCTSSDGNWIGLTGLNRLTIISSDGGATWRTNAIAGQTIDCSANGTNWIIAGNQIYTSVDAGVTWVTNFSSAQWLGGLVSADGAELAAVGSGQGIWIGRVVPSPQLNIQSQTPNVTISWLIPSTNFVLQQTADLSNPTWTPVSTTPTLNFTNLQQQVTAPAAGSNSFFRLSAQ